MQLADIDLDLGQIVFGDDLGELVDRGDIDKAPRLLGSGAGRLFHAGLLGLERDGGVGGRADRIARSPEQIKG